MENTPILVVKGLHTYYGQSHILHGVDLALDEGAVVAVLGRNGVGKTTLIRSLIGFTLPREGHIFFNGQDIAQWESFRRVKAGLAVVPQGRHIFSSLTLEENLLSSANPRMKKNPWDLERIFDLFPQFKTKRRIRGAQLSGGEQQMLAIGRALISNPDLLLLDEPTEGLAPLIIGGLIEVLSQIKKEGQSILFVEQNLKFTLNIAGYVFILSRGKVAYESTSPELSRNPGVQLTYLGVARREKRA